MRYIYFCFILLVSAMWLQAKNYKGAELRTKETYLYGRFEVSYMASYGSGQTSTFFTYNDDYPNTPWNEIDIEIMGRYSDDVQFNTITPKQTNHVRHQFVNFDPTVDYHTYAFEWTPAYVAWFIDGAEVYRQSGEHITELQYPQKIMMNIWYPAYANWAGTMDDRCLPFFAYYDYVSYSSYTPGQGNCGSNNNFTQEWTDHFDTFNTNKWQKATHTWTGNNVDFIHDNCLFRDGKMILCLTDNDNTGFTDRNPPVILWTSRQGDTITVQFSEKIKNNSAETAANYIISGINIQEARLLSNLRTVRLKAQGMKSETVYNLVCLNIKDYADPPNKQLGQSIKIIEREPLQFPFKINVGSNAHDDYQTDQPWDPEFNYGYEDGSSQGTTQPIEGTDNDMIYRSWRQGLATYRIRVPHGSYSIDLLFAENTYESADIRTFDVYAEDSKRINALDIYQVAGKHHAYKETISDITVSDGQLDIHFSALKKEPVLCGIEIQQLSTSVNNIDTGINNYFILGSNYPNPFNNQTIIPYILYDKGNISLDIYDLKGRLVYTSEIGEKLPGQHIIPWKATVPSGQYFYRLLLETNHYIWSDSKKMTYIR